MKRMYFLLVLALCCISSYGQTTKIDSMQALLKIEEANFEKQYEVFYATSKTTLARIAALQENIKMIENELIMDDMTQNIDPALLIDNSELDSTSVENAIAEYSNKSDVPQIPTIFTIIKFDEETYDWGTVIDGEKMTHVFKFKNTGNEPLIISDAKGSCGCTVPEWPKDPIPPGGRGEVKVVFDSRGKGAQGGKEDSKKVTIKANTDPAETYLTIKGKIDKKEK